MDTAHEVPMGGVKYPAYAEMLGEVYATIVEECDAKIRAYAFILESGLLDEFRRWADDRAGEDPHRLCMESLDKLADERQKRGKK